MIRASSLRYFLVVSPCPAWMWIALAAAVIIGCVTLWLNPAEIDSAFGSILLLQMFSASSGYAAAAARGYYDPLLVSGRSRTCVALANLSAAVLPGALAWIAITVTAAILGRADLALTMHRHVAMVIVSAVAWAGGLALPRMAAGALWSLALVTLAMSRLIPDYLFLVRMSPVGLHHEAAALTFAICPYLLLGDFTAASEPRVIGVDMLLVGALVWVGVRYIARREYPLVEPV